MTRLVIALALACALLAAAPATGQDAEQKKRVLDARIDNLESKIDQAREREGVLSSQIEEATGKINALEGEVDTAESRLDRLESLLALQQRRLDHLNELFHLQTSRLVFLRRQHAVATQRLNRRVVEIYTSDPTEPLSVVLEAASFGDMLDQLEFLSDIGRQDEKIVAEVRRAKRDMRATREATKKIRNAQVRTTREVEARTEEQRAVRDRLAWSQRELATARRDKESTLASVQESKAEALAHMEDLLAESASLAATIQAAQAAAAGRSSSSYSMPSRTPSASGFIWPVHGVVTSVFGWRWGRMHEGIDIAVGSGTPVVASAAGTVIVAGWMGGYGNLVVVDHGNGIATAYGHNTNVTVFVGQSVGQGQLIAYSGNTGHSTGPHVHFEVRVGGAAVDPFGYL
ncbi:MAG: peptidoglycan DD-metalloendopeptidase family protein [Actinobacteria bacterium]|nr:peptidoglycan DD-metalloendopeptidase family protein [Actinomycetota bacterium]